MKPVSSKCLLNGNDVEEATALRQGDVIQFGDCLKFRFNNPKEASLLLEKRRSGNFTAEVAASIFIFLLLAHVLIGCYQLIFVIWP